MSPEHVKLHAEIRSAKLVEGDLDAALARCIERREQAAFAAGQLAGRQAALVQGLSRLDQACTGFETAMARWSESLVGDSVELALSIASELVRAEVSARRHGVETIVRDTLAASGVGRGGCTVHLSPADATAAAGIAFRSATRVEADPDVADGCVQVETPHGLLVRDLNAALASIGARLREEARS